MTGAAQQRATQQAIPWRRRRARRSTPPGTSRRRPWPPPHGSQRQRGNRVGPARPAGASTRGGPGDSDAGRAMIEVVFLAVLLLIPTTYILLSVIKVQASTFAVTQAARDAGRLIDAAPTVQIGVQRARQAAQIALADQQVDASTIEIRFTAPGRPCAQGVTDPPALRPGADVDICVTAVISLPGVPTVVTGGDNTVTGVYTLHVGEFAERG